jgi:hypothetical protein
MTNVLRTDTDYELFIYSLVEQFPSVQHSTLTFVRRGSSLARIAGEIFLEGDYRIVIRERILYHRLPMVIDWYGYEVYKNNEKLYWYDPQPHPNEPSLQITHPHHKHVPPNMRRNRIPAPNMSFMEANLPKLIDEVTKLLLADNADI